MTGKVAFKTIGCRLNQAETSELAALFAAQGFHVVPFGEACDICVIHTCAVTHKAVTDSARAARLARTRCGNPLVVIAGCAVEICGPPLVARTRADLAVGQAAKYTLPNILQRREKCFPPGTILPAPAVAPQPPSCDDSALAYWPTADFPAAAGMFTKFCTTRPMLKVQDGCDFGCTYCIVPRARGPSRSRPLRQITGQARALTAAGYREIVLTGANLGTYRDGKARLPELLAALESIQGLERIRLSSIECSTTEREVIDYMASSSKLCPALHIPMQSGDDRVLRSMGRRYTSEDFRRLVAHAVEKVPFLGLGTDILVGFPGEDDAAFAATVNMVNDLPFNNLHVFAYSKRPGTPAAVMTRQVPETIKRDRVAELIKIAQRKREQFACRFVRREVSVLIEEVSPGGDEGFGWTREKVRARVRQPGLQVNQIVNFVPRSCDQGILS